MTDETFDVSRLFQITLDALRRGVRYIWHEGGTRSSKTYSIACAVLAYTIETGASVDVVRATLPPLKATVLEDLKEIGERTGWFGDAQHHITGRLIRPIDGGRLEYYGVDDEQKVRGRKRGVLWMNEANEISDDKRRQLWMRTTRSIIIDVNPTFDEDHWIVKKLEAAVARGECLHIKSTYLDNPFLEDAVVREIESMQFDDPYGWKIYGLGERGSNPAAVFQSVELGTFDPQGETVYGVDFGFNDPFTVCEWGWRDSDPPRRKRPTLYCRPLLHDSHLTTGDAIALLAKMSGVDKSKPMWCDSAEPDRIKELRDAGYQAKKVRKAEGMRDAGYDWLKRHDIVIDAKSDRAPQVRAELRRTSHKKKPGSDKYTDEVVDRDDHVADAARYGAFSKWGRASRGGFYSTHA